MLDLPPPTGPISSRMRLRTSSRCAAESKILDDLLERLLEAKDLVLEELIAAISPRRLVSVPAAMIML